MSEFSRVFDAVRLPVGEQLLEASEAECTALAQRFGLIAVKAMKARLAFVPDGPTVRVTGQLEAQVVQSCAVSGDDLPARINEPVALHFVPAIAAAEGDAELELDAADLDEIEMDGTRFDLGEAVAQGMALAIDPYAEGPTAKEARRRAGLLDEGSSGPFAALKGLLKD